MKRLIVMIVLVSAFGALLQGCGPVLVGGTAVSATTMLHDRRDAGAVVDDRNIVFQIHSQISGDDSPFAEKASIGVTSYNRVVLLTGQAKTAQIKQQIHGIAQGAPTVKRVVNEITVTPLPSIADESNDTYLTSQVKLALFRIQLPDFDPTRIKVVTEQRVVYLMGLVSEQEGNAAVEKARYVKGVERVVRLFERYQPKS